MSTAPQPPAGTVTTGQPGAAPPAPRKIDHIVVYGHSNLLYWWPVWLVSFVLAAVTYAEGQQMAVVPDGTAVETQARVPGAAEPRDILIAPKGHHFGLAPGEAEGKRGPAGMTVSSNNSLGVIFVATLFVVAIASTILLRGLVSLVAIALLVILTVTLALFGWWNDVLRFLGGMDIRMNAAGYLAVGVPLFFAWLVVVLVYDRAHYVVFDRGQIRYVLEVGDSEVALQADGAVLEKKRNDVFRHWLLGFGTGDLIIRTGGGHGQSIELENVINISRKLVVIDQMLKEKAITVDQ